MAETEQEKKNRESVFGPRERKELSLSSQLKFPLDPTSVRIIQNIIIYPVSVRLKATDAATDVNYGTFFVSDRQYLVLAVAETHGTAGSDGSAVTLQIERLQGTEALTNGDEILSSTIDLKGTANTTVFPAIKDTGVAAIQRGDRLALKDAGTLTAVDDLLVTVYLQVI